MTLRGSGDAEAAATIDLVGGPGRPAPAPIEVSGRGLFGRRKRGVAPAEERLAFPTVAGTGVDPVVQGGTLEELLSGRPYEEIELDPRWGHSLAVREGGERLVLSLTDGLIDALARASPEKLAAVALPWSQTEEFWGAGDAQSLTALLLDLSRLAREARTRGESVYCWVCV